MIFENGEKSVLAAAYNGARTVITMSRIAKFFFEQIDAHYYFLLTTLSYFSL